MIKKRAKFSPAVDWVIAILALVILLCNRAFSWSMLVKLLQGALGVLCAAALLFLVFFFFYWRYIRKNNLPSEDALEYLKTRKLAPNRFEDAAAAVAFVQELYRLGATKVMVDGIRKTGGNKEDTYADTLVVTLPAEPKKRKIFFDLCAREEREDGIGETEITKDKGQKKLGFWWD